MDALVHVEGFEFIHDGSDVGKFQGAVWLDVSFSITIVENFYTSKSFSGPSRIWWTLEVNPLCSRPALSLRINVNEVLLKNRRLLSVVLYVALIFFEEKHFSYT